MTKILKYFILFLSFYVFSGVAAEGFYQQPVSEFITNPDEKETVSLYFNHTFAGVVQSKIDSVKASNPNSLLAVHFRGTVFVEDQALTVPSKTFLSFEGCGQMQAIGASLDAMIHIKDAEYVSITSVDSLAIAKIEGSNIARVGVLVSNSGKVNIDNINISNCLEYGVDYEGQGASFLNEAGSVTRSQITNCKQNGIRVSKSTRFVLLDNVVSGADCGINIYSKSATIVGNKCFDNEKGLRVNHPDNIAGPGVLIGRNILTDNTYGLELGSTTKYNVVTENTIKNNGTGFIADGYRNHIYNNYLENNTKSFDVKGNTNIIAQHKGIASTEVEGGSGTRFFNPPTIGNPHNDAVIITGMGRRDLTFTSAAGDTMDLAGVQTALDAERTNYPNDVIVLWLNGTFVAQGEHTGLDVPAHTCVVLDGTIFPKGDGMDQRSDEDHYQKDQHTGGTQLVLLDATGYNSFSGGTLDCKDHCAWGIYAPANNVGIIDSVRIKDAVDNNIGVLHHKGSATPMFIRGCHFSGSWSTNRAIWLHMCNNIHCISNLSERHVADYADVDYGAHYNTVLFSTAIEEKRTGVFIEEEASNNICVGNTVLGEYGNGISLYNAMGNGKHCEHNIIVANKINGPFGMNIRHAKNTLAFNNICHTGRFGVYINVDGNYSSQNSLIENNHSLPNLSTNPFFNSPYFSYLPAGGLVCDEKIYKGTPTIKSVVSEDMSEVKLTIVLDSVNKTGGDIVFGLEDTGDGSATSGEDYEAIPAGSKVTIAQGSKEGDFTLKLINDTKNEYDESISLKLILLQDLALAMRQESFDIKLYDDEAYVASIEALDDLVNEETDSEAIVKITLNRKNVSGASIQVPIKVIETNTVRGGADFVALADDETVEIKDGDSTATFTFDIINDTDLELKEKVEVKVSAIDNILVLDSMTSFSIEEADQATAELLDVDVYENDTNGLVFKVVLSGRNETYQSIKFDFEDLDNGEAFMDDDYVAFPTDAKIIIPIGSDTGYIHTDLIDNAMKDYEKDLNVQISNCNSDRVSITKPEASAYIIDDETTSGIDAAELNNTLVFPNPTTDVINIKGDYLKNATIKIITLNGEVVYQQTLSSNKVNINHLNAGIYMLCIEDNKHQLKLKLIKL